MFSSLKEKAAAFALRTFVNHHIKHLGHMTTLRIDTQAHRMEITAELLGETAPIDAKIDYRLEDRDGATTLIPTNVECSRPWLELLAKQLLADNSIKVPIPPGIASTVVKMLKL